MNDNTVDSLEPSDFSSINETLYQLGLPDDLKGLDTCDTKPYSQIMRVPGTYNRKTEDSKLCHIIHDDGDVFNLSSLLSVIGASSAHLNKTSSAQSKKIAHAIQNTHAKNKSENAVQEVSEHTDSQDEFLKAC